MTAQSVSFAPLVCGGNHWVYVTTLHTTTTTAAATSISTEQCACGATRQVARSVFGRVPATYYTEWTP